MIYCDYCNICVHQHCYHIAKIPEQEWYCDICSYKLESKLYKITNYTEPRSIICHQTGGAMKKLYNESNKWCHIYCALIIPELYYPIDNYPYNSKRVKLKDLTD